MTMFLKRLPGPALAGLLGLLLAAPAHGQVGGANIGRPLPGFNPFFQVGPGLSLQQAAMNTQVMGRAFSYVPPNATPFVYPFSNPGAVSANFPQNFANSLVSTLGTNTGALGFSGLGAFNGLGGISGYTGGVAGLSGISGTYGGGYGGYSGYTNIPSSAYDPVSPVIQALASMTDAQGRFLTAKEQANLMKEQVKREKLETRRKYIDEWLYEREKMPTWEDERMSIFKQDVRSALMAPTTQIASANALNTLLRDLRRLPQTQLQAVPPIPVDEDTLKQINITSPRNNFNVGIFKVNEGRPVWPPVLRANAEFKSFRDKLDELIPQALEQAVAAKVDPGVIRDIKDNLRQMIKVLRYNVADIPPSEYGLAKDYLVKYESAVRVFDEPSPGDWIGQKYTLKGKDIQEVVKFMIDKGLEFAPAAPGQEPAYVALHHALALYDQGANAQLAADR